MPIPIDYELDLFDDETDLFAQIIPLIVDPIVLSEPCEDE